MRKIEGIKIVTTLALAMMILALALAVPVAASYTVDGDLSDWRITPAELNRGLNDSSIAGQSGDPNAWVPDSDTADWIVEDNRDPDTPGWGSYYGVHIKGTGSSYSTYDEPLVHLDPPHCDITYPEPYGGEAYDVEAMYFDDDEYYAYFAIVVSSETYLGDFYLEVNGEEYGIVLKDRYYAGLYQGEIYRGPDWIPSDDVCEVKKVMINSSAPGTYVGMAEVAIGDTGIYDFNSTDYNYTNYVVEIGVRKTLIGCPENCTFSDISYACSCGNDHIENEVHYDYPCIPEFLTVAIPAGMVIGLVYIWKRRQRK